MVQKEFIVSGMTCSACKANVEKAVAKLDGIKSVNVNLLKENMTVTFDSNTVNEKQIINACNSIGYGTSLKDFSQSNEKSSYKSEWQKREQRESEKKTKMKNRVIYSFLFLIPLMYIAMGGMLGLPLPQILSHEKGILTNTITQLLLTIPVMVINKKFFISGFKGLKNRVPNMDSLVAIGSFCSFFYGIIALYNIAYGFSSDNEVLIHKFAHELYFESSAMILTLVTVGKYLETVSKSKTSDALGKLIELSPKTANVLKDAIEITVLAENVKKDDFLIVRPGEVISVDGIISEGSGFIDQSAVTGESIPVEKNEGDEVICATLNKNGTFKMKATKVGNDTTLSKIIELVDSAANTKAPIARLADKVSGIFVPVVICIALVTFVAWILFDKNFDLALSNAITVLVISCPCALGLATPVAIMAGTGKAAENGILIKSAESLEMLSTVTTVVLDKTGTITSGKMSVTDILVFDNNYNKNEFLKYAYALENGSEHPISTAIKEKAVSLNFELIPADDFKAYSGKGISAEINGNFWISGNEKLFNEFNISTEKIKTSIKNLKSAGKTTLIFAENKNIVGVIAVSDTIKNSSKDAVEALKKLNKEVIVLTGDNKETAKIVAESVGANDYLAEVLPEDKSEFVNKLKMNGKKVAMVGDGINDAPALALADVGIAIGAGTDIAIDSADIVLMKSSLKDIVTAVELSKSVIRNIKINLFWAFFYNILGIPVASGILYPFFGIKLTPMFASLAMSLSSLTVVSNALRLRFFKTRFTFYDVELTSKKVNINKINLKEELKMTKTLTVTGMMCPKCENHVKNALLSIDGVTDAVANHEQNSATVTLNKDIPLNILIDAIVKEGYEAE